MKQQMVKINTGKFTKVKSQFASNLDGLSSGITKLTAMEGGVTPEQVSQVLSEEVLPAIEGVKNVIAQIDEALPSADQGMGGGGEEGGLGGLGEAPEEEEETGVLSAMNTDGLDEGEDEDDLMTASDAPKNSDAADAALQKRLQHVEAKLASVLSENFKMKKASLAKKFASVFPPHMRTAMEEEFMEEDDNLEALEAKLNTASRVVDSYRTANLIKKSNIPVTTQSYRTAKNDQKGGRKGAIPWNMR